MRVDVWSDVVCPWCYLGEARLRRAVEAFEPAGSVEVVFHSFQLDPRATSDPDTGDLAVTHTDRLAAKLGVSEAEVLDLDARLEHLAVQEGLTYRLPQVRSANTRDAHRVLHLAHRRGVQQAVLERLFRAVFSEGRGIGDRSVLVELAAGAGLDAAEVRETLDAGAFADDVDADLAQARAYGITGVPFFVLDGRLGVSGAQSTEVLTDALRQAWETRPAEASTPTQTPAQAPARAVPAGVSDPREP